MNKKRFGISEKEDYTIRVWSQEGKYLGSFTDNNMRNMSNIFSLARDFARRQHARCGRFSVYCIENDTFVAYKCTNSMYVRE